MAFRNQKSKLAILFIIALIFSSLGTAFAAGHSDIEGHWAKDEILQWTEQGKIEGYPDGTFRPNNSITRAEFIAIINRALNYEEVEEISYSDVPAGAWYASEIAKAAAAGYIAGYSDGTMRPNKSISRQEVSTIITRIDNLAGNSTEADKFIDAGDIAGWSKESVGAVAKAGFMTGYKDGTFRPLNDITRAEAVVTLNRVLESAEVTTYNQPGNYGPIVAILEHPGNVVIDAAGVSLSNMIIKGDLIITEAVGNGEVYLNNVTVEGDTFVNGGGADSIYFRNFSGETVEVNVASGNVRVVAEGETKVTNVNMKSGGKLENNSAVGSGFSNVTVSEKASIVLKGSYESVDVVASGSDINVESGAINTVNVGSGVAEESTNITLGENAGVGTLNVNGNVSVSGSGNIISANIAADNTNLDLKSGNVEALTVAENILNANVNTTADVVISNLIANGAVSIKGEAVVKRAIVAAENVILEKAPEESLVKEGVTTNLGGEEKAGDKSDNDIENAKSEVSKRVKERQEEVSKPAPTEPKDDSGSGGGGGGAAPGPSDPDPSDPVDPVDPGDEVSPAREAMVEFLAGIAGIYYTTDTDELVGVLEDFRDDNRYTVRKLFGEDFTADDVIEFLIATRDKLPSVVNSDINGLVTVFAGNDDEIKEQMYIWLKEAMLEVVKEDGGDFEHFKTKLANIGWSTDLLVEQQEELADVVDQGGKAELALGKAFVRSQTELIGKETDGSNTTFSISILGRNPLGEAALLFDWHSSNEDVAEMEGGGPTLTAKNNGKTTITAELEWAGEEVWILKFDVRVVDDSIEIVNGDENGEVPSDRIERLAYELSKMHSYLDEDDKQHIRAAREKLQGLTEDPADYRWDDVIEPLLTNQVEALYSK
ncbi:hypothetical protein GGQ84_000866 [Desulfitispora alkaliphila]|uniref:S-layer homology domain-containing protein n=1 Tax=Desulfitispora alkaliphila TaxID=622674 RepID=UPI003D210217